MIFEEVKIVSEFYELAFVTLPLFIGATAFGTGAFLLTLYALRFLPSGSAGGTLTSLGLIFLLASGGGYLYTHTIVKVESAQSVPLSVIDNKVRVEGDKVIIDPLDEKYSYNTLRTLDDKRFVPQTFRFKYDEFYKQGWLVDAGGREIKLSNEDTEYLKNKQS